MAKWAGHANLAETITVYNSMDNGYNRHTTDKFNKKVKDEQLVLDRQIRGEVIKNKNEILLNLKSNRFYAIEKSQEYFDKFKNNK